MRGSRLFDPKPDRTHRQASVGQGMSMLRMCSDCNQRRPQLGGSINRRTRLLFETAQSWVWRGRRVDGDVRKLRVGDRVRLDDMEPGRALLYPISGISEGVVQ